MVDFTQEQKREVRRRERQAWWTIRFADLERFYLAAKALRPTSQQGAKE